MARHEKMQKTWKLVEQFYDNLKTGININDAQPAAGKTYSFIEHVKKYPKIKYVFFSSNHSHLEEIEKHLNKYNISNVHWQGFTRLCLRYPKIISNELTDDEKFVHKIYTKLPSGIAIKFLCATCNKEGCKYQSQFNVKATVVLAPLEFLFRSDIDEKFKEIWVDETIKKIVKFNWDFSFNTISKFIKNLESIKEKKLEILWYCAKLLQILHKELLQQTSIIFRYPAKNFIEYNNKSFCGEQWTSIGVKREQGSDMIVHYAEIDYEKIYLYLRKTARKEFNSLYNPNFRNPIYGIIIANIREAIRRGQVEKFLDCYCSIEKYFEIVDILSYYDGYKGGAIVAEKIEIVDEWEIKEPKIIEETDEYIRGFVGDKPFLLDKKNNKYYISKMDNDFTGEEIKESWFVVGLPYMMMLFDIAHNKPVILMDATFNKTVFNEYFCNYNLSRELKKLKELEPEHYIETPKIQNKESVIYKIGEAKYPTGYLKYKSKQEDTAPIETIIQKLKPLIKELQKKGEKIGTIVPKDYEKELQKILRKNFVTHFFAQRGTNALKEVDYLIIIGTPYVPPVQVLYDYVLHFGKIPKNPNAIKDKRLGFLCYEDKLLNEFLKINVYDELYQAIHRCRPLLSSKKIILYGILLPELEQEFTCKTVSFDECVVEILGAKKYYQDMPEKMLKLLAGRDKAIENMIKKIIESDPSTNNITPLVTHLSNKLQLDAVISEEIILYALNPVKDKIINLLNRARYKRMSITKVHNNTGYPRPIVELALWLLRKDSRVEIIDETRNRKMVKLN